MRLLPKVIRGLTALGRIDTLARSAGNSSMSKPSSDEPAVGTAGAVGATALFVGAPFGFSWPSARFYVSNGRAAAAGTPRGRASAGGGGGRREGGAP